MDLPELPFEKVLSYLSLADLLKSRAVSRAWYHRINSFRVQSLCISSRSSDYILGKSRLISGTFAQNFISTTRLECFIDPFGRTILSNLKHLRLCDFVLYTGSEERFAKILQSFGQLKSLDLIGVRLNTWPHSFELELNLPMLNSIHLEEMTELQLTLDAPALKAVKLLDCFVMQVHFVHGESVERLVTSTMEHVEANNLKKLRYLCSPTFREKDSTLLPSLDELKELHLQYGHDVDRLFEQKKRYGRTDLKIFLRGGLLSGLDDPAIATDPTGPNDDILVRLTSNTSRLADEIPILSILGYHQLEAVAPESRLSLLRRFVDLKIIYVDQPIQDIDRFLDLLKNLHIVQLTFWTFTSPPQHLFDRLPEHCAVQKLFIRQRPSDLAFLFRMKHLIHCLFGWSIDGELIRKVFEELPYLQRFEFSYENRRFTVDENRRFTVECTYWFEVWGQDLAIVPNLDAVIQYITYSSR